MAEPREPLDTWRVCGNPVDPAERHIGCTCLPFDPSALRSSEAARRLAGERAETPEATTRTPDGPQ